MTAKSDAIETAAISMMLAHTHAEAAPSPRARAASDRALAELMHLVAPRLRHFIRHYGLTDVREDAEQMGAIAIHQAALTFDPCRARFTTHVSWQLRGAMQALRHQWRTDHRGSAKRVGAVTISFDAYHDAGANMLDQIIADDFAELITERGASDYLAGLVADRLLEEFAARRTPPPARDADAKGRSGPQVSALAKSTAAVEASWAHHRAVIRGQLLGAPDVADADRPMVRRAIRGIQERRRQLH